jgi:hypothetical protein
MLYEEGYTIAGARKVLRQNSNPVSSSADLHWIKKELKGILALLH